LQTSQAPETPEPFFCPRRAFGLGGPVVAGTLLTGFVVELLSRHDVEPGVFLRDRFPLGSQGFFLGFCWISMRWIFPNQCERRL
jgi:hypothetical protein